MVAASAVHFSDTATYLEPRRLVTLRAARRRSQAVRWARRAALAAMGALVATIAGLCAINIVNQAIPTTQAIDAAAVRMINPRFTGRDAHSRPYVIIADAAVRRPAEPARLELENPRMTVMEGGAPNFEVTADRGEYNRDNATLDLQGDVRLVSGEDYEFETSQARLFIQSGIAEGREPLVGRGAFGVINADAFELYRDERRVVFEGSPVIGRLDQEPKLMAPLRSNANVDGADQPAVDAG